MKSRRPSTSPTERLSRKLSFSTGCLFELALLVVAALWGWLVHRPALLDLHWSLNAALIGTVAAIPPFVFFLWTLNSKLHVCFGTGN
jgi:hypothetical protein